MASNSPALPRKLSSFSVCFHRLSLFFKNLTLTGSSFEASMEDGSSGEAPPAGEAMVIETWGARTS